MEYHLYLLVFVSIFAQNFAQLAEKPPIIEVNEENQEEFDLPLGTKLELDERTQLYKPPPLANNFTAHDRIKIMWKNPISHKNYCKVGPSLHRNVFKRMSESYFWYTWCVNQSNVDLCCDNKKCTCGGPKGSDCACLTDEAHDFYEDKKEKDKMLAKGIFAFGVKVVQKIIETKGNSEAGDESESKEDKEPEKK